MRRQVWKRVRSPLRSGRRIPWNSVGRIGAVSAAPSDTGVNLDTLRPAVFAPSVADFLMLEMPQVESGSYATGTITTAATSGAKAQDRGGK